MGLAIAVTSLQSLLGRNSKFAVVKPEAAVAANSAATEGQPIT
jgi:hypothetical protein